MRWMLLFCFIATCMPAFAQNYPAVGQLSGRVQNSTMSYDCLLKQATLHCQFTQVLFSKQTVLTAAQIDESVSQGLQSRFTPEQCEEIASNTEILQSGGTFGTPLSELERADAITLLGLFSDACNDFSDRTLRAIIEAGEETKARTCNVGTLPFVLDFTWNSVTARWETVSQPNGTCGVVTSAFFEFIDTAPGALIKGWTYHQLKMATNRQGSDDPLFGACADYANDESYSDFLPRTIKLQCDYLKFSLF